MDQYDIMSLVKSVRVCRDNPENVVMEVTVSHTGILEFLQKYLPESTQKYHTMSLYIEETQEEQV